MDPAVAVGPHEGVQPGQGCAGRSRDRQRAPRISTQRPRRGGDGPTQLAQIEGATRLISECLDRQPPQDYRSALLAALPARDLVRRRFHIVWHATRSLLKARHTASPASWPF